MAIFKRGGKLVEVDGKRKRVGGVYWYHFCFNGRHIQESTKQGNPNVARQMEGAHRTALAKGEAGFREKKYVPTLAEFMRDRVEPWATATFEQVSHKTWLWYRTGLRSIQAYSPLASLKLDAITTEHSADFTANLQAKRLEITTVNSSLQVLRRCLRLAAEWGVIPGAPKVKLLRGVRHWERVISPEEEARYLAAAPEPLASIAAVLVDSGMRPEECFRLRWDYINWTFGRHGSMQITHGKTDAARRLLPMTARVREILESRWNDQDKPEVGWVWPARIASNHAEPSTIKKQHARTFQTIAEQAKQNNRKPVCPFVLYTLRHTFLTRLGESGCNVWTLARIAGHSSIAMSARYVHPNEEAVFNALTQMQSKPQTEAQTARPVLPHRTQ